MFVSPAKERFKMNIKRIDYDYVNGEYEETNLEEKESSGEKSVDDMTTSEIMTKIGAHYLFNGCNGCDFLEVAEVCDAIPLNCCYLKLARYFKREEDNKRCQHQ